MSKNESTWREANRQFVDQMFRDAESDFEEIEVYDAAARRLDSETEIADLRRGKRKRSRTDDPVSVVTLRDTDGVLRWDLGAGFETALSGKRRRRSTSQLGDVIKQIKFEDIEPNQIDKQLRLLDGRLTPNQGLRAVENADGDSWSVGNRDVLPVANGRILLLVHGTFSNCESLVPSILHSRKGKELFRWAQQNYDQILAFNHPTLSVNPLMNALDLSRAFRDSLADVDVVSHSRGGLVVRWWLESVDRHVDRQFRSIFFGSPLAGTSLAAPHRIKHTINLLTNVSRALSIGTQVGAMVAPFGKSLFLAATGLLRVFSRVTSSLARTPAIDGGMAIVPGLAAQSRQGANAGIQRLRDGFRVMGNAERLNRYLRNYYFVTGNFEPKSEEWWKFWKYFNRKVIINRWSDRLFDAPNDLVVDTGSMNDLVDHEHLSEAQKKLLHKTNVCAFRTSTVHHTNYFEQTRAMTFLLNSLRS